MSFVLNICIDKLKITSDCFDPNKNSSINKCINYPLIWLTNRKNRSKTAYYFSFLVTDYLLTYLSVLVCYLLLPFKNISNLELIFLVQVLITNKLILSYIPTFIFSSNRIFQMFSFCFYIPMLFLTFVFIRLLMFCFNSYSFFMSNHLLYFYYLKKKLLVSFSK